MKLYAGKSGGFTIVDFPETFFPIDKWTYVADNGLIDISNTGANGTEQYISNLHAGSLKASGLVTEDIVISFNLAEIEAGMEIYVNLWVDFENGLGFEEIPFIIDDITFSDDINDKATFDLTAVISEPK